MLIGYARVSTHEQNLDLQEDAMKAAGCDSDPTNSVRDICRTLGISKATLYRYLAEQRRR